MLVFAALFALSTAQCTVEGNTYSIADGQTVTFGTAVGSWVPGLLHMGDVNSVHYLTWVQDGNRWTVQEYGVSSGDNQFCKYEGIYLIDFFNGCNEVHFTVIHDLCGDRRTFLLPAFSVVVVEDGGSCIGTGNSITTTLRDSTLYPRLAGDAATIVFGADAFALASVSDQTVIVQRWRLGTDGAVDNIQIVDLASFPAGYSCDSAVVGTYSVRWSGCSARVCHQDDTCQQRTELFHNIGLNGYEGDFCSRDIVNDDVSATCSKGKQWNQHPKDCLAQDVPGKCMFCQGIAMGVTTSWCMDREGQGCNKIFTSPVSQTYCNIAFECPASVIPLSITLIISAFMLRLLAF